MMVFVLSACVKIVEGCHNALVSCWLFKRCEVKKEFQVKNRPCFAGDL